MLKVSDEKLVVAAVKGDCKALEELKERAIYSQYGINDALNSMRCSNDEKKYLEPKITEIVFSDLHNYRFIYPFQTFGFRLASLTAKIYKENNTDRLPNKESLKEKVVPNVPLTLSNAHVKPKHPPLEQIDLEIRSLVSLLNQSPDIQTTLSCSGHPNQGEWKTCKWSPYGGYIELKPVSSVGKTLDFLNCLIMWLDNTNMSTNDTDLPVLQQMKRNTQQDNTTSAKAIRKRYKQVDAESLYFSGGPIVLLGVSFRFFICHREEKNRLEIWKKLIVCLKEFIPEDESLDVEVDTAEIASQCLQKALQQLPFLFSATLVTSREGYPGIVLNTQANLAVCQWFSALAAQLYAHLNETEYAESLDTAENPPFIMKWSFSLRPFLNQELIPLPHLLTQQWKPRTPEEHLKIWELLELTVAEMLDSSI